MQIVIAILFSTALVSGIYLNILYIVISRKHLKNIFEKLSTSPNINPKWIFTTGVAEYPKGIITKIFFINRLAGIAFCRNWKRRKNKESYKVIVPLLNTAELKILTEQARLAIIIFILLFAAIFLYWFYQL